MEEEVAKLLNNGFIRDVKYLDWLVNIVFPKKNGKWRVFFDYKDLNKACSEDSFPVPNIDQLVESTTKHELLSFLDAYFGYDQIKIDSGD